MESTVTALGAMVGLLIAIFFILKKMHPAYGLMAGALIGGIVGGANLMEVVSLMLSGAKGMMPAVLRIITAGILAGILIQSGAASTIATRIVNKIGVNKAIIALAFSTMLLTASGVFIDIAVITVSPIAIALTQKSHLSRMGILIAMIGGGKAGNLISPNPNTIAAAENFHLPLTSVMYAGLLPAVVGLCVSCLIAYKLSKKGSFVKSEELIENHKEKPSFFASILGPLVAISLLMLRPLVGWVIDPLLALPLGGVAGLLAMGKLKYFNSYATYGLPKMTGVAIILIGTGTLAGIIANSNLKELLEIGIDAFGLPALALAPLAGIFMSGATASTTSGTAVASAVFGPSMMALGISPLAAAAMTHAGATVLDHLPHGSFFHATGGSVNMEMKERWRLIPYESLIGLLMTLSSILLFSLM